MGQIISWQKMNQRQQIINNLESENKNSNILIDFDDISNNDLLSDQEKIYICIKYDLSKELIKILNKKNIEQIHFSKNIREKILGIHCVDGYVDKLYTEIENIDQFNNKRIFVYKLKKTIIDLVCKINLEISIEDIKKILSQTYIIYDHSNFYSDKLKLLENKILLSSYVQTLFNTLLNTSINVLNDTTQITNWENIKLKTFLYCYDNFSMRHSEYMNFFHFDISELFEIIYTVIPVCYLQDTFIQNIVLKNAKVTRKKRKYVKCFQYTNSIKEVSPRNLEELAISNRKKYVQKSEFLSEEFIFMKIYDQQSKLNVSNLSNQSNPLYKLIILCDRIGFFNLVTLLLNNTETKLNGYIYDYLLRSSYCEHYKKTISYANYLVSINFQIIKQLNNDVCYNSNTYSNADGCDYSHAHYLVSNNLQITNQSNKNVCTNTNNNTNINTNTDADTDADTNINPINSNLRKTSGMVNLISYNEILNIVQTEENWLFNNIKFEPLLEKIILEIPTCLILNINPKKILIKSFRIEKLVCDLNDSEQILFFVLRNNLNISKNIHTNEQSSELLNNLFYDIFKKLNDDCTPCVTYLYNSDVDYYSKLLELFEFQYSGSI